MLRRFLLRAFCCAVLALPAACSTIGGGGPQALEDASPLDADPHALVVALTKPAALPVEDGDLALSLSWAVPGRDAQEERAGLQVARRLGAAPGRDTVELVLAPDDAERMSALLSEIRADKQKGIEGKGAFSVSFTARCVDGGFDLADMVVDVALTLQPGEPAIPLLKNSKFGALLAARGIERLPDCGRGA
ncbi:hypothetical protein [Martelella mediterranea]|uniref:Lipoprotein n=1 Tax=Martelella mediterranea DSM 17316 TaxID=1122214 RepID=A0A1U9Z0Q5_9HYPH|nr:hypothetical protein [Martelella mediterranea]AQZ51182.1 hypothetical protein Mame_01840 [Martelella mediterranea DSM 17316]